MSVSFQGYIPASEKRHNTKWAIVSAPILSSSIVLSEVLFNKNLRKDTFVKTAKACAKNFTTNCKNIAAGFCKYILRSDKLANKAFNLAPNNKLVFAAGMLLNTAFYAGIMKMAMDSASKFRHHKDN